MYNRILRTKAIITIIIATIFLLLPGPLLSQNNPYKINDRLYPYFCKCDRNKKSRDLLAMSDTLYHMARTLNDKKAQCIALYFRAVYFFNIKDFPQFFKEKENLRNFSVKTGYTQFYFGAWDYLITYYLNNYLFNNALTELNQYQKDALKFKSPFGIGFSYIKIGNVYARQGNQAQAIEEYKKAERYFKSINKLSELYTVHEMIANAYKDNEQNKEAIEYFLVALKETVREEERGYIYTMLANCYYSLNDSAKGNYYFSRYNQWKNSSNYIEGNEFARYMMYINYYMRKRQYEKALTYCDSLNNPITAALERSFIYSQKNDYEKAYNNYLIYSNLSTEKNKKDVQNKIAQYSALFDNEKLKSEKNELALKNQTMLLEQLRANQELLLLDKEKSRLALANTHLELNNKNLLVRNQKSEVIKQKTEAQRQQEKVKNLMIIEHKNRSIALLLFIVLIIITASSLTYIILHRISVRKLKHEMKVTEDARNEAVAANEKAEKARIEAENANKLKTVFLQNMSHEIRTPLNSIVGFSNILTDPTMELDDDSKKQFNEIINSNTTLLTTLINDILDLSTLESDNYKVHFGMESLDALCANTLSSVKGRQKEGVKLSFKAPNEDVQLYTDIARTQQLLINFLTNACKYTDKGSITLTFEKRDNDVVFSVTDTGRGIDPAYADKIFERFEKLDSFVQGSGLGLNICRKIAQLLHGQVMLDTSYTSGCRFLFIHPLCQPE
jgi:signal transduction histidine kinase